MRITNGSLEGRIWIHNGDLVDAETQELIGEPAFQRILSWKTGNFEIQLAQPKRPRTIMTSYQGLLLETVQALDEAQSQQDSAGRADAEGPPTERASGLAGLSRFKGVEFGLSVPHDEKQKPESRGIEDSGRLAKWTRTTMRQFRSLGETLNTGQLDHIEGVGLQNHVGLVPHLSRDFLIGFNRGFAKDQVRDTLKNIVAHWAS